MPPKLADSKYTDTIFGETHTDIHYRFWLSLPVNREYIEKNYAKILTEQTSSLNLIKENTEKFLKDEYEKAYHSFYEYRAAKNNLSTDKRTSYKKAFHLTNHWVKCQCVDKKTFSCFENQKFHLGKKQLITTSDKNDRLCLPRSICFMASIIDSNNENVFASFGRLHLVDFVLLLFSFVFDGYDKNNPYLFFELIGNNYYPKLKGLPTISKDESHISKLQNTNRYALSPHSSFLCQNHS